MEAAVLSLARWKLPKTEAKDNNMKTSDLTVSLAVALFAVLSTGVTKAQGTVNFNNPWIDNGVGYFALRYIDGLSFRVSDPSQAGASLAIIGASLPGHPSNATPHLEPSSGLPPAFLIFAYTNAASSGQSFLNGAPFGLASVDLADPLAPSPAPVSITFNGFRADNSMVTQTFTVGGGGVSSFQKLLFNADFSSSLVRVEIPSAAWAMDNLVFIPEPASCALLGLGLLALASRRVLRKCKMTRPANSAT